jgi:hypothetical protein
MDNKTCPFRVQVLVVDNEEDALALTGAKGLEQAKMQRLISS